MSATEPSAHEGADSPTAVPNQDKKGSPNDFLKGVIGRRVIVRLNSGIDYHGTLSCLDGYMNIAMEETSEYVDGVRKSTFGDAFIRGNNVLYITAVDM
ncbi:U4/U6-U5 snRNP complex subunit lsm6 [Malassezia sp. CBS 17886]|nr:U4/U6-U5 snRNP complex subunit lsm6 [Malassezia sp. CBS 17886]